MTPAEALREKLDVSIFADELFGENCFLIRRRDTAAALVVDPGLQLDRVVRQLREERLTVERILVTHGLGPARTAALHSPRIWALLD